jgi:uncharacterized membrane protein
MHAVGLHLLLIVVGVLLLALLLQLLLMQVLLLSIALHARWRNPDFAVR